MKPSLKNCLACLILGVFTGTLHGMEPVGLSSNGDGFQLAESGEAFVPWGFNYDHNAAGQLLEDYWESDWEAVVADFQEMQELGANVVRIHLQFGRFMQSPDESRQPALDRLAALIALAEETNLYLDVTGLGCYHKQDVPVWYNELSESERWQAQAEFWKAVTEVCSQSPAIFCYDLMNEPVVPGGDRPAQDWLGPAFGDKHFTQFISLDRAGRPRVEIARQWIHTLVQGIRSVDDRHLITVGMVPWSLDRPGLTSGFVPKEVSAELDFIAVHLYPEQDRLQEALETLQGFAAVGKPVVIEEIFPLRCNAEQLGEFIESSQGTAAGWIGFYWGTTPQQYRQGEQTIGNAMTLSWLELFQQQKPTVKTKPER